SARGGGQAAAHRHSAPRHRDRARHRHLHAIGRLLGLYRPDRRAGGPHQGRVGQAHDGHRHRRRRLPVRGRNRLYRP
ncbi:hypothetical protein LTR94_038001, partial [Friedmanniomyces endolithicus]